MKVQDFKDQPTTNFLVTTIIDQFFGRSLTKILANQPTTNFLVTTMTNFLVTTMTNFLVNQ